MAPMARWISQGKADRPWTKLDVVGHSGTYQTNELEAEKTEDSWSTKVEQGSI